MSRGTNGAQVWLTAAMRAGWAVLLLSRPDRLLRAGGAEPRPAAVAVVRVLGTRHLLQAAITAGLATPTVLSLGALADTAHACSCVALAAGSARWRRVALADALIEAGFAAAGWSNRRRATNLGQAGPHRDPGGTTPTPRSRA